MYEIQSRNGFLACGSSAPPGGRLLLSLRLSISSVEMYRVRLPVRPVHARLPVTRDLSLDVLRCAYWGSGDAGEYRAPSPKEKANFLI